MIGKSKLIRALKHLSGSLLPMLFWILLTFGFDKPYVAILSFSAAGLHELGHIVAALLTDVAATGIRGRLNGLKIRLSPTASYKSRAIILLAGPATNIVIGSALILADRNGGYLFLFGAINLVTAVSNLLPFEGYDGYGLLSLIATAGGLEGLQQKIKSLSLLLTALTAFFSLYLMMRLGVRYWIFAVFFTALITKTAQKGKS